MAQESFATPDMLGNTYPPAVFIDMQRDTSEGAKELRALLRVFFSKGVRLCGPTASRRELHPHPVQQTEWCVHHTDGRALMRRRRAKLCRCSPAGHAHAARCPATAGMTQRISQSVDILQAHNVPAATIPVRGARCRLLRSPCCSPAPCPTLRPYMACKAAGCRRAAAAPFLDVFNRKSSAY